MKLPDRPTLYRLQGPFECSILKMSTWTQYARAIDLLVEFFGKDREPQDITRAEVGHYKAWLSEKKNFKEGTIKSHVSMCSGFYTWMMHAEVEGVYINPFKDLPPIPFSTKEPQQIHI